MKYSSAINICSNVFKSKKVLERHFKVHKNICSECGKVFKRIDSLKKHELIHKPESNENFPCDNCDKSFKFEKAYAN